MKNTSQLNQMKHKPLTVNQLIKEIQTMKMKNLNAFARFQIAKPKDKHKHYLAFLIARINQINEWRNEAIKHAFTPEQRAAVDARAFELRNKAEA